MCPLTTFPKSPVSPRATWGQVFEIRIEPKLGAVATGHSASLFCPRTSTCPLRQGDTAIRHGANCRLGLSSFSLVGWKHPAQLWRGAGHGVPQIPQSVTLSQPKGGVRETGSVFCIVFRNLFIRRGCYLLAVASQARG